MKKNEMKLCVASQTPLISFLLPEEHLRKKYDKTPLELQELKEGEDYEFTAGGVTRMVYPLLLEMRKRGLVKTAHWVSLNPRAPSSLPSSGLFLHHLKLEEGRLSGYGAAKEALWRMFHGLSKEALEFLWQDEFIDYTYFNRSCAEFLMNLERENDFDLFYVHDFQMLPLGHMLNLLKPKLFRWHIPFDETLLPQEWKPLLSLYFNSYDAVVVSCRKYLDSLKGLGYKGKAVHIYPYIDEKAYGRPKRREVETLCQKFGIGEDERVVLVVARLDPMKGQDKAIEGFAKIRIPGTKLMLVGNGSFSSSKRGMGLSKGEKWLNHLRGLARELGVEDRVIFAGYLNHEELQAAYDRCEATILPSVLEGFGLVVIESWLYRKPALVSLRAGVAELIREGENGLLFDPLRPEELAEKLSLVLSDERLAASLGERGFETSSHCSLGRGVEEEAMEMEELIGGKKE